MFEGFADVMVDLGDVRLRVRLGGEGPAVLLIHGHPRTSATWHRVAPELITAGFTVVCPDIRGYGRSSKPIIRDDHRAITRNTVTLSQLGPTISKSGLSDLSGSRVLPNTTSDAPPKTAPPAIPRGRMNAARA